MRYFIFIFMAMQIFTNEAFAQQKQEPWNSNQLMKPSTLAERINNHKVENLLILSVGPGALIKGSVDIGETHEQQNIDKLKSYLCDIPRDREVVVYCGCCPFDKCPNIRPAFKILKELKFKNAKLLNLSENIKVNWLDKNYPTED